MDIAELDRQIAEIMEKGFDESFIRYCAETFSSYTYAPSNLAAARRHAFYLRLFMDERLSGGIAFEVDGLHGVVQMIGEKTVDETLSLQHPSGKAFCRLFVRNWCRSFSLEEESVN